MKRKFLIPLSVVAAAAVFVASLLGETTPFPFASRTDAASQRPATQAITIAFWNIQWFPGARPNATAGEQHRQSNAVHSDIRQFNADIIGMEEVRNFAQASVAVQPLPGFKVDVCANFPPREGQNEAQEVAIASRLQPLSAWAEQWKPAGAMTPPRGFAFAAYEIAPRQMLLVYDVHLKSNRGDIRENISLRQESVRQLRSHMDAMQTAYGKLGTITWIVGGDFNTSLDDNRFAGETTLRGLLDRGFAWIWQNIPLSTRATLPPGKDFPPACFDHIFYRGGSLRRAWVANTSAQSSDHRAIVAILDIPSAAK